jgi:hypothetical protein
MHKLNAALSARLDPVAVRSVTAAYGIALGEIAEGCGYLPPRECRRAIGSRMLAKAEAGERDPERLKIWGLAATEDFEAIPLALAFAALLRRAAEKAARPDE